MEALEAVGQVPMGRPVSFLSYLRHLLLQTCARPKFYCTRVCDLVCHWHVYIYIYIYMVYSMFCSLGTLDGIASILGFCLNLTELPGDVERGQ